MRKKKYQCTCSHVQYVCKKLGVGTEKLNSIRMLAAYHSNVKHNVCINV